MSGNPELAKLKNIRCSVFQILYSYFFNIFIYIHIGSGKRGIANFFVTNDLIIQSLSEVIVNINFLFCRSCFELLLSVPENEIPFDAWVQFHHSVQVQHCNVLHRSKGSIVPDNFSRFVCSHILCHPYVKPFITSPQLMRHNYVSRM